MTFCAIPPLFIPLIIVIVSIGHHHDQAVAFGFGFGGGGGGGGGSVHSNYIPIHHRRQVQARRPYSVVLSLKYEDGDGDGDGDNLTPPALLETDTKKIRLSENTPIAEIMTCLPTTHVHTKRPLVFIHGSFHASWCWAEHYLPHFARQGYPCYALSLRGTGGTPAGDGVTRVKIDDHVEDVTAFVKYVVREEEDLQSARVGGIVADPVLVGHSFGGLTLMKYLESYLLIPKDDNDDHSRSTDSSNLPPLPPISGIALLCSVPPSGNGKMTLRFLRRSLVDSYKITMGMASRKCITNTKLCRTLFFDGQERRPGRDKKGNNRVGGNEKLKDDFGLSDLDLKRYQQYFQRDTVATIDIADLSKKLPSAHVVSGDDDGSGRAVFADRIPPALIVGAKHDFIVDREGVQETARYFGMDGAYTMVDSPHDVMLGRNWGEGADVLMGWLERIAKPRVSE